MSDRGLYPVGNEPEEADAEEARSGVERWILPYFHDSSLWPVLFVVLAHLVAFLVPVVLFAFRDRSLAGIAAAGLLFYMSFQTIRWEWKRGGRPGPLSGTVVAVWTLAGVAGYFADRTGIF